MAKSFVFKRIPNDDINVNQFQTFKNWSIDNTDYTSSYGMTIKRAITPKKSDGYGGVSKFPIGSTKVSDELTNPDDSYQKVTWHSLNNLYYRERTAVFTDAWKDNTRFQQAYLYETASILSIPHEIFGEAIKKESVVITDNTYGTINLKDDGCGNIIDDDLDTGSMVPAKNLMAYWGFNDQYQDTDTEKTKKIFDKSDHEHTLDYDNVTFVRGINTTGAYTKPSGHMAQLSGNGQLYIEEPSKLNFEYDEDFAISLWTILPPSQSNITGSYNWIVSKQGDKMVTYWNSVTALEEKYLQTYTGEYPYSIKVYNQETSDNGKVVVSRYDIDTEPFITSSTVINDSSQHHICFNKTGSTLELWIDGALEGSTTDTTRDTVSNKAILTLGSKDVRNGTGLSGSLDEIRFYNKGLSSAEISSLSNNDFTTGSAYNTARVGNVFYRQGQIIVTDPRPKYQNVMLGHSGSFGYTVSGSNGFTTKFRSTQTIYEHEILCRIGEGEFNLTMNPTIREYNKETSERIKGFSTGSSFCPYVTTIGLYNDHGQLLVIGKTGQPIPLRCDVDTTFIVRYDHMYKTL